MKLKMMVVCLGVAVGLLFSACQQEGAEPNEVTIYNDCCCCDGDSVMPLPSGVQIVVLADISQGREGYLDVFDDQDQLVAELVITVQNGQQFGFELAPGQYWATITGLAMTSYVEFEVREGQTEVVVIEMYEWPVITWYANLHVFSPGGEKTPGLNLEILRFNLIHDWSEDLQPDHFIFNLGATPSVSITSCYLAYQDPQTGNFLNLGTAPVDNGVVRFSLDLGNLADSTIAAYDSTTYKLSCDVFASTNDVVQASLVEFAGQPLTTAQQVWTLPLYGFVLNF